MHPHITSLQLSVLAMAALLLGVRLQPKPEDLLMGAAPAKAEPEATLVTSGGFCVTLSEQGRLLTQPAISNRTSHSAGMSAPCNWPGDAWSPEGKMVWDGGVPGDESHQWQWQGIGCSIGRCRCAWMWRVAVTSPPPRRMLWRPPEL